MRRRVALSVVGLMASLACGCNQGSNSPTGSGPSGVGAKAAAGGSTQNLAWSGEHSIDTFADVPVSTSLQGGNAVCDLGGKKRAVEFDKGRVLLDGAEQAKLPDGTKKVGIRYVGGQLSVTADGKAVPTTGTAR